ncbi:MAG: thioredoxin domain-containing protein [Candidatus Bathyarchaeia archaeon]
MAKLTKKTIPITRMDCPTCIPLLEREVKQLEGVEEVQGNYMNKTLKVTYNPNRIQLTDIEATIERLGYQIAYKKYPGVISRLRGLLKREEVDIVQSLTDTNFPGKVLHASKPVAVLFSSPTCPICRVLKKQFKEIAEKVEGRSDLYEMDITSTETWRKYNILSIPTVLVFRDGRLSERFEAIPRGEDIAHALDIENKS